MEVHKLDRGLDVTYDTFFTIDLQEPITLLLIDVPDQTYIHLTPLSPLQQRILSLLCFPVEIYTQLSVDDAVP